MKAVDAFERYRETTRNIGKSNIRLKINWSVKNSPPILTEAKEASNRLSLTVSTLFDIMLEQHGKAFYPDADDDAIDAYRRIWMDCWDRSTSLTQQDLYVLRDAGIMAIDSSQK